MMLSLKSVLILINFKLIKARKSHKKSEDKGRGNDVLERWHDELLTISDCL